MKKILPLILFCLYLYMNGQIYNAGTIFSVYHNINPDTLHTYTVAPFTNQVLGLNLFGSSSDDIEFTARGAVSSGGSSAYIKVKSLNPNVFLLFGRWDSVYAPGSSDWFVTKIAKPLHLGDTINSMGAVWDTTDLYMTDHSGHSGGNKNVNDWVGGEKYLGIKYQNGSTTSYGWIRLECLSEDSCYSKDFSYSTTSSLAVNEFERSNLKIYPNPTTDIFYLNANTSTFDFSKMRITDMYGQSIEFKCETEGSNIKICPAKNLAEGCYLVQYFSDGNMLTKKLIKSSQ